MSLAGLRTRASALMIGLAAQFLAPAAFAQTKPAVELEGAINKEQVDGDLKTAIAAYQKIAADTSASRDIRSKALLHLAGCYEKLGQQAQKVYEQIVRDFADQPAAAQARARLARYTTQVAALKELKPQRLTANTPELTIQRAVISPDGKFVGYSDPLGIHIRSLASGETRLLPGTDGQWLVKWNPDASSVQTVQDAGGKSRSMVVSLRGGAPTLAPSCEDPCGTVASPDLADRATVSSDGRQLSIQDANGQNSRELWRSAGKSTFYGLQWSPNGKQIAVLSSAYDSQNQRSDFTLELIEVASGKKDVLVSAEKKLAILSVVWASQNRLILAIDEDLGINRYNSNLWEVRLNGGGALVAGGLRRLTSWTDFPIRASSLSTDGKRLVFIRSFRQRDVYVAPLEAGGTRMGTPRRLTLDLGDDYPSGWTRDSQAVILTSNRNGQQGIFRQRLDEQTADQIVVMPGRQLLARVTPDGNSVLFRSVELGKPKSELMRVPIAGGTPQAVPNSENVGSSYRCAPAGVCQVTEKHEQEYIISELNVATGKGREIFRDNDASNSDVSPDGKWIAHSSGGGPDTKIVLRSFETGTVVLEIPVHGVTKLSGFDYAPDGKGFFTSDSSLAEGREMYIDLSGNTSILWRQSGTGSEIWGVPSPDGKYLALVLVTDDSNVYMVENF